MLLVALIAGLLVGFGAGAFAMAAHEASLLVSLATVSATGALTVVTVAFGVAFLPGLMNRGRDAATVHLDPQERVQFSIRSSPSR